MGSWSNYKQTYNKFRMMLHTQSGKIIALAGPLQHLQVKASKGDIYSYSPYETPEEEYSFEAFLDHKSLPQTVAQLIAAMTPKEKDTLLKMLPNAVYAAKVAEATHMDPWEQQTIYTASQTYYNTPQWSTDAKIQYYSNPVASNPYSNWMKTTVPKFTQVIPPAPDPF